MQRVRRGIAIIGGVLSVVYLAMAMKYPMGSLSRPGPRVYPLFVGILLLVSSLGIGLGAKSKPASDRVRMAEGRGAVANVSSPCSEPDLCRRTALSGPLNYQCRGNDGSPARHGHAFLASQDWIGIGNWNRFLVPF